MKKTNVLFFTYKMGEGGAARTLLNIINHMDRTMFTPVLVTLDFNGDYEKNVQNDVTVIKIPQKRLRHAIFPLARLIRQVRPDIVFSTIPVYNTIAILATRLSLTRAKNVIREADNLGGTYKQNMKLACFGRLYKRASQTVALSEGVKENLVRRYHLKARDINVIYNPIDIEHIQCQLREGTMSPAHRLLFTGKEKVIITAGRLVRQKDHHTLLDAFAKTRLHVPSKLLVLGEGPLQGELMRYAKELHINEHVFFLGFQANPYIYMAHADLFVLTSIHEGFSHVIAEALATGLPVVATDCQSGPREVLDNGRFGRLCRVGDPDDIAGQMRFVLTYAHDKRQQVVQAGRERARFFQANKLVKEYERLFLATLSE